MLALLAFFAIHVFQVATQGDRQSDALDDHRMVPTGMKRRIFIASSLSTLAGCGPISAALSQNTRRTARARIGRGTQSRADRHARPGARVSRRATSTGSFRVNGFATPSDARYTALVAGQLRRVPADRRRRRRAAARAEPRASSRRCRNARRSRATIASKAGARSASGAACRSAAVLDAVQPRAGRALRRLPLHGQRRRGQSILREPRSSSSAPSAGAARDCGSTTRRSIPITARPFA